MGCSELINVPKWQAVVNLLFPMMFAHKKELLARKAPLPAELVGLLDYAHKSPFVELRDHKKEVAPAPKADIVYLPVVEVSNTPAKKDKLPCFTKNKAEKPDHKSTRLILSFSSSIDF